MGNIIKCRGCDGRGYTAFIYRTGPDEYEEDFDRCDSCRGMGYHNLMIRFWKCLSNDWSTAHIWRKQAFKTYEHDF